MRQVPTSPCSTSGWFDRQDRERQMHLRWLGPPLWNAFRDNERSSRGQGSRAETASGFPARCVRREVLMRYVALDFEATCEDRSSGAANRASSRARRMPVVGLRWSMSGLFPAGSRRPRPRVPGYDLPRIRSTTQHSRLCSSSRPWARRYRSVQPASSSAPARMGSRPKPLPRSIRPLSRRQRYSTAAIPDRSGRAGTCRRRDSGRGWAVVAARPCRSCRWPACNYNYFPASTSSNSS
jgi:hypothetical protein